MKPVFPPEPSIILEEQVREEQAPKWSQETKLRFAKYHDMVSQMEQDYLEHNGKSINANLVLNAAEEYLKFDKFYYPYTVDFRGRAYPKPSYLNHIGDDAQRSLLRFHTKKPLGSRGLYWLKVQLSNHFGNDKVSNDDRAQWTDNHLDEILASALDPMENLFWTTFDCPFQGLAAAHELLDATTHPLGPEAFESGLPIQQDGSCNGLQHYAALGRDTNGGMQVNLKPNDTGQPADVYMQVCNSVQAEVAEKAKLFETDDFFKLLRHGSENDRRDRISKAAIKLLLKSHKNKHEEECLLVLYCKIMDGNIKRKTVKQTVMTSVYGVTSLGARAQIRERLREHNQDMDALTERNDDLAEALKIDGQLVDPIADFVSRLTMKAIGASFVGAVQVMDMLKESAGIVAKTGQPVQWVTPMGLPVKQPYREPRKVQIRTDLQRVTIMDDSSLVPISKYKQRSAFPPNFVHSLDSTHMMMTALECQRLGVTFASVHDSFWCHAQDVDEMSRVLREEFVRLHSQDLLGDLHDQLRFAFPEETFPLPPPKGDLDLNEVLKSPFFFN